jgi:signal peptidase I
VRRWKSSTAADEDDEDEGSAPPPGKPPVFWRARDSLYFEPLVALAIVVLLIVGMYAYTQNWPPVYVVESKSMQHGTNDIVGLINTGDLVLAQKISSNAIVPYVIGMQTGYSTYGEYGDVILYQPNGQSATPIIHRAILFLTWTPYGTYDASDLAGLPCGSAPNAVFATFAPGSSTPSCSTTNLTGTLDLYGIGWRSANVSLPMSPTLLGAHSGFLTMGDNNFADSDCTTSCVGLPDPLEGFSQLVEPGWIIGVARGMIPWVGAIKLALQGQASMVPSQSWQFLGLTVVALILLAFGIHYLFRAEGIEDPRRKKEEEEEARERADAADDEEDDEPPTRTHRFLTALRPWRAKDDEEDDLTPPRRAAKPTRAEKLTARRGRPRPHVRRAEKKRPRPPTDDDDEL